MRPWRLSVVGLLVAGCSYGLFPPDVVFESVEHREVDCPTGTVDDVACLRVTAPAVGSGTGSGWCAVYPVGFGETVREVARVDDVAMTAGEDFEWDVQVALPADPAFEGWNPACGPMIEG